MQLSDYSERFHSHTQEKFEAYVAKTESGIERLRTELDIGMIERFAVGRQVLDFPIGPGRIAERLMARYEVYGFDISKLFVEHVKQRHPEIAERFEVHAFENLSTARSFDTVISMRCIRHLADESVAMKAVYGILRPGGRWLFTHPDADGQTRGRLVEAGFELRAAQRYDVYPHRDDLGRPLRAVWRLAMALAARNLMPRWCYAILDRYSATDAGTYFFVAEKPTGSAADAGS